MPELKNSFQQGKMNKDLDERLVPNGQYRHAMNIEVSTSESGSTSDSSNVGTVQNILGNKLLDGQEFISLTTDVACIQDGKNDSIYWLLSGRDRNTINNPEGTEWIWTKDYILKYSENSGVQPVFVDLKNIRFNHIPFPVANHTLSEDIITSLSKKELYITGNESKIYKGMKFSPHVSSGPVNSPGLDYLAIVSDVQEFVTADSAGNQIPSSTKITFEENFQLPSHVNVSDILFFEFYLGCLEFSPNRRITGINIMDDMIFWTDGHTEPKKINITRSIAGTIGWHDHTRLVLNSYNADSNELVQTEHITVIRKPPNTPPKIDFSSNTGANSGVHAYCYMDIFTLGQGDILDFTSSGQFGGNLNSASTGGWRMQPVDAMPYNGSEAFNWREGDTLEFLWEEDGDVDQDSFPFFRTTIPHMTARVVNIFENKPQNSCGYGGTGGINDPSNPNDPLPCRWVQVQVLSVNFSPNMQVGHRKYAVQKHRRVTNLFEFKFPRFGYRYKYDDGEYSTFSPWSNVVFNPGRFKFDPGEGFNLGMTNNIKELSIKDFIPTDIPSDVVQVDLLYKESDLPNVYIIDSIRPNDIPETGMSFNSWKTPGTGDNFGYYRITSETIFASVPENQLIRVFDSVPRTAKAQDIVGNRIVYGNYLKNHNLTSDGESFGAKINVTVRPMHPPEWNFKSVKTLREYQVGVVFLDEYNRESPVLTSASSTVVIPKSLSNKSNILEIKPTTPPPDFASGYKFYVKETSTEYYNIVLDRWYEAKDGNIWLSFHSHDRNKLDEETYLYLKRGHDGQAILEDEYKYRILAIENEAPEYIKKRYSSIGAKIGQIKTDDGWTHEIITEDELNAHLWDNQADPADNRFNLPCKGRQRFSVNSDETNDYFKVDSSWHSLLNESGAKSLWNNRGLSCRFVEYSFEETYIDTLADNSFNFRFYPERPAKTSEWYKITKLSGTGKHSVGTLGVQMLQTARVWFDLEKKLGEDCNFVNPTGNEETAGEVPANVGLEIAMESFDHLHEFDGRFFVKVIKDQTVKEQVTVINGETGGNWQIEASTKLYYFDHPGDGTGNSALIASDPTNPNAGELVTYKEYTEGDMKPTTTDAFDAVRAEWALYFGNGGRKLSNKPNSPIWFIDKLKYAGSQWGNPGFTYAPDDPDVQNGNLVPFRWSDARPASLANAWSTNVSLSTFHNNGSNNDHGGGQPTGVIGTNHPLYDGSTQYHSIPWTENANDWNTGDFTNSTYGTTDPHKVLQNGFYRPNDNTHHQSSNFGKRITSGTAIPMGTPSGQGQQIFGETWSGKSGWDVGGILGSANSIVNIGYGGLANTTDDDFNTYQFFNVAAPSGAIGPSGTFGDSDGDGSGIGIVGDQIDISYCGAGIINAELSWGMHGHRHRSGSGGNYGKYSHSERKIYYKNGDEVTYHSSLYEGEHMGHAPNQKHFNDLDGGGYKFNGIGRTVMQDPEAQKVADSMIVGSKFRFRPNGSNVNTDFQIYEITAVQKFHRWNYLDNYLWINGLEPTPWLSYQYRSDYNEYDDMAGVVRAGYEDVLTRIIPNPIYTWYVHGANGDYNQNLTDPMFTYSSVYGVTRSGWYGDEHFSVTETESGVTPYDPNNPLHVPNLIGNMQSRFNSQNKRLTFRLTVNPPIGNNGTWFDPTVDADHDTAVDIEFVAPSDINNDGTEDRISPTPGIWETVPKEDTALDLYYQASRIYPISLDSKSIQNILPVGCRVSSNNDLDGSPVLLDTIGGSTIKLNGANGGSNMFLPPGSILRFSFDDGINFVEYETEGYHVGQAHALYGTVDSPVLEQNTPSIKLNPKGFNQQKSLNWFNCFSFANGVESNRIRDVFNAKTIDKGPRVSTTAGWQYAEEHLGSGLVFSGIYNSKTGVNNTNQFIDAERPYKDLNPEFGTIQKLHARDTDIIALCEDKILKIVANKDALYNAEGNPQLVSSTAVLGQAVPFVGEYGISKNPESFASESFRAYFTDRQRGAVLRLSRDGLTPISKHGMEDWFRDKLSKSRELIGSYDVRKSEYNLTIRPSYNYIKDYNDETLSFSEYVTGWTSFKSFHQNNGISLNNDYFTFNAGKIWQHHIPENEVGRNTFYGTSTASKISVILNEAPSIIKSFKTLNYEGSQSLVAQNLDERDVLYTNLTSKPGWAVDIVKTNKQDGTLQDFIEKEGKWFGYLKGVPRPIADTITGVVGQDFMGNELKTEEFSFQGLGYVDDAYNVNALIPGCTDPTADNYNPAATTDDGSCYWSPSPGASGAGA